MASQSLSRPIRTCREHERRWQDRYVDKNLKDTWLEELNALSLFNMINICEGHAKRRAPRGRFPHIFLRLKGQYMPVSIETFDAISIKIQEKIIELFGDDTTAADLEFKIKMNSLKTRQEIHRDFVVHITCGDARLNEAMDKKTINWFENTVRKIKEFDTFSSDLMNT
ncbi:MAG: hypothetical protein ACYSUL_12560 [Planctomycetota bacterium]|jgi:hypothetical protein